ncbi:MAG: Crp/Fnr family transcriptional regulator, partial [Thermostichales cyanobacterium SRBZ-1_bins_19]
VGEQWERTLPARGRFPLSPGALYRLESGAVRLLTWDPQGEMVTLNICGAGEVLGLPLCWVGGSEAVVECLTRARLRQIPPQQWGEEVLGLCRYSQQVQELLCILQLRSIPERLQRLIRCLDRRFGRQIPSGRLVDLPLSHRQIAETLGTTRVTITRLLSRYQNQGRLRRAFRRLILLDPSLWAQD